MSFGVVFYISTTMSQAAAGSSVSLCCKLESFFELIKIRGFSFFILIDLTQILINYKTEVLVAVMTEN
jgi:hypothetical protein